MWFDTLCIRQDEEHHKLEQIPLMGSIYAGAEAVVVLLGGGGSPGSVVEDVEELEGFFGPLSARMEREWGLLSSSEFWREDGREKMAKLFVKVLDRVWRSEWATRVWTLQEYVLAKEVIWAGTDLESFVLQDYLLRYVPYLMLAAKKLTFEGDAFLRRGVLRVIKTTEMRVERREGTFHGPAKDVTRIMHLGARSNTTRAEDAIYGIMAASGLVIEPKSGEGLEGAWTRWWEEAVRSGYVRWLVLAPVRYTDGPRVELGPTDLDDFNCTMPPTKHRALASESASTPDVKAYGNVSVDAGTVSLLGRRVGTIKNLAYLGHGVRRADMSKNYDRSVCLLARGSPNIARRVVTALINAAGDIHPSKQEMDDMAKILVENYDKAAKDLLNAEDTFVWDFTSPSQREALKVFRNDLLNWSSLDLMFISDVFLATVEIPLLGLDTEVFVFTDQELNGTLLIFDVNAMNIIGGRTVLVLGSEEDGTDLSNTPMHKFGVALLSLHPSAEKSVNGKPVPSPWDESPWDEIPLQMLSIGGRRCPNCIKFRTR